jgi:formate dehydrogenase major subunit
MIRIRPKPKARRVPKSSRCFPIAAPLRFLDRLVVRSKAACETRNICPLLLGQLRDHHVQLRRQGEERQVVDHHIEGDPDHPINRGALCPKCAALLDFIKAPTRLLYPEISGAGLGRVEAGFSWDWAMERIAKLVKEDRDKNFIAKNKDGLTVNRWVSTGFLAASATTNETAFLTYKIARSLEIVAFDNQARV